MEHTFENLTIFEFQEKFPDDQACLNYLAELKWSTGFICPHCGHNKYCNGGKAHIRQCTKCRHLISPTSGTLFHKVKFPLLKAFYFVYLISNNKDGFNVKELSDILGISHKTCNLFKNKVIQEMKIRKTKNNNRKIIKQKLTVPELFESDKIAQDSTISSDSWLGYQTIRKDFTKTVQKKSNKKGKTFKIY